MDHRLWAKSCSLRISLELLFYPLAYHAYLQRLGLITARPLLPPAKSFIPFSVSSPLLPFSLHHDASSSILCFFKAALTSPFVFVCVEHLCERWVYSAVNEAIETAIIQPTNPDMPMADDGTKARKDAILGLRIRSPPTVRRAINNLLTFVGWREPDHALPKRPTRSATVTINNNQVTDLARLDIPLAHQEAQAPIALGDDDEVIIPVASLTEVLSRPTLSSHPPSPIASQTSPEDSDPTIRITRREGIVEMEVRLPPHVLSSHTELAGSGTSTPRRDLEATTPGRTPGTQPYHRVTQLSVEPAGMIGAVVKAQLVGWMTLPLKLLTLRLVASHYLAGHHGHVGSRRVVDPFSAMGDVSWPSVGTQVSRIALCGALELAIDLSLWGAQYLTVAYTGSSFGWGAL
jgi:hypothetical protein